MIRTVLAQGGSELARGALAFVLEAEDDIEVVATLGEFTAVGKALRAHDPAVVVLDLDLLSVDEELPQLWSLQRGRPGGKLLALLENRRSHLIGDLLGVQADGIGFVAKDGPPGRLVSAVRKVAEGEQVFDPDLVVSAVRHDCPLTNRENQVLRMAAEGLPVSEIAQRLLLAPGTVRNHLSRVISKTGARTSIEAVRIAQRAGWV